MDKMDLNLKTLLDTVEVTCPKEKCAAKMKHELMGEHFEKDCKELEYICKQGSCTQSGIKGLHELQKHFDECEFTQYVCPKCEETFKEKPEDHDCIEHIKKVIKDLRDELKAVKA